MGDDEKKDVSWRAYFDKKAMWKNQHDS